MQCGRFSALLCDSVCIGIGCCVCFFQQCCVYGKNRKKVPFSTVTVLYCVTVCIVVFALDVLRSAMLSLWKEQTESEVWHVYCCIV